MKSRIVELRYFGGMTLEETAEALGNRSRYSFGQLATCQSLVGAGDSWTRSLSKTAHKI
jgi:hypothetical protein